MSLRSKGSLPAAALLAAALWGSGCGGCGAPHVADPLETLAQPSLTGREHRRALETLDEQAPNDPETVKTLTHILSANGYALSVREAALDRLAERDLEGLKRTIRQTLPRTNAWGWVTRLSEIIAERGWADLTPALISSWARPVLYVRDDLERPEYLALAALHGAERVTDVVFQTFMEARSVGEQHLRTRCWELLHRLGQRERLLNLLASADAPEDDAMLIDLRAGARDLGIVPYTREEILWLRELCRPERAEFWSRAVHAVEGLDAARRASLEMRDLPIVVSASLHEPELLALSERELYARVETLLKGGRHHVQDSNYDGFADNSRQRLYDFRGMLTWGDLAAMLIALRACELPQVRAHLFDYAERDRADETTEYGGVIRLDAQDRFEILEFPPVWREHDQKFIASQAMFDAAYDSIFHFHMHAQAHRNGKYAGPGFGDTNYADSTRANCLVFTFMNEKTLNVDYYRHGRVVVDLGEIKRP